MSTDTQDEREHDVLAHDLADWLSAPHQDPGFLTWENVEFRIKGNPNSLVCRPDVFAIQATLAEKSWRPRVYEVKVNRADLLADLKAEKWKKYRRFAARIIFAMPATLSLQVELPKEVGLIIPGEAGWVWTRLGGFNKEWKLNPVDMMNLCLKGRNPSPHEREIIERLEAVVA